MKLFQLYTSIIDDIKPVEVAWLTTFNLDLELTERFLLSKLGNKEPSELNKAEDFEGLNEELKSIDIKIWYDFRALNMRSNKRTTVDMISVDPRLFQNSTSSEIVFHPKVIFLSGKGGTYLIAGSANLSIAAWSSNKESILVKRITSRTNALEIESFFKRLIKVTEVKSLMPNFLKSWVNSFPEKKTDWNFFHSFSPEQSLFNKVKPGKLTLWSPYFSRHSADFLQLLIKQGYCPITIVPDVMASGKIRITPDELVLINKNKNLSIQVSKDVDDLQTNDPRFAHAKVWITDSQLAIGSWNCSFRATGLKTVLSEQNIEAGIITSVSEPDYKKLLNTIKPSGSEQINGTSENDLDQEWKEVLNEFSVECKVFADWQNFTYTYKCNNPEGLNIKLPDRPNEAFPLTSITQKSFFDHYERVLKNKFFSVFDQTEKLVFTGYLIEVNKSSRQTYSYTNFFDVFDSLINDPAGETHRKICQYRLEEENETDQERNDLVLNYKGHESYYMMFVAFQRLFDSLQEYQDNEFKLDQMGFRLPGSLSRISELFIRTAEPFRKEEDEEKRIFYYFLGLEINRCIYVFNEYSPQEIKYLDIEYLFNSYLPSQQDSKFMKVLKHNFEYIDTGH